MTIPCGYKYTIAHISFCKRMLMDVPTTPRQREEALTLAASPLGQLIEPADDVGFAMMLEAMKLGEGRALDLFGREMFSILAQLNPSLQSAFDAAYSRNVGVP